MYLFRTVLIASAALTLSATAFADDLKKQWTTPPDELSQLKFFVGSWHCEGTTTPPAAVGKPFANKVNLTYASTLDGFWIGVTNDGEKVPGQPVPNTGKGEGRLGYDRVAKQFVNLGVSNRGGWSMGTSKGWETDKLVWSGSASGTIKADFHTTITKKGDSEFHLVGERQDGTKWVTSDDVVCKKK